MLYINDMMTSRRCIYAGTRIRWTKPQSRCSPFDTNVKGRSSSPTPPLMVHILIAGKWGPGMVLCTREKAWEMG